MNLDYDVSIIIVNYNGKRYIDNLFESLCNVDHTNIRFEVVFVDNASTDDSISYLTEKKYGERLDLKIVKSDKNLGFAGGNNLGVENAKGKYVIFLNNDTAVDKKWLENLYFFIVDNDYGMVNSKLLFFYDFVKLTFKTTDQIIFDRVIRINGQDYTIDNKFCKNLLCEKEEITAFGHSEIDIPLLENIADYKIELHLKKWNKESDKLICCDNEFTDTYENRITFEVNSSTIEKHKYSLVQNAGSGIDENYNGYDIGFCKLDGEEFSKPYEINNGCGAAIILKKEDFINCGEFDEKFFMYYEDTDLSYRIKKMGKKIWYCPDAVVRHIHTGSSKEWSDFFIYHVNRNKLLFLWKNVSKVVFWRYYIKYFIDALLSRSEVKRRSIRDVVKIIFSSR